MKDYSRLQGQAKIDAMLSDYKRMAKSADQKLRRLEKLSQQQGYQQVLRYAYAEAMNALQSFGGAKRFDTKPPMTEKGNIDLRQLKRKMNAIEQFMEKPTSNKRGIEATYNKRSQTIKERYGVELTPDETKSFYESALWTKLNSRFGSKTAMKIIAKVQENIDDLKALMDKSKSSHQSIPNLVEKIKKNPKYYSKDLQEIATDTLYNKNLDPEIYEFMSKNRKDFSTLFWD